MKLRLQIANRKLKGYSLTEVLFNMILITLVVSCGYLAYNYSISDLNLFDRANEQFQQFVQLKNAITIDAEKSNTVTVADKQITFHGNTTTKYKLLQEKAIRESDNSTDTFFVQSKSIIAYYNEREITEGLTEKIQLETETGGKHLRIIVNKRYDAFTKLMEDGN